jgi:hypothetical protein
MGFIVRLLKFAIAVAMLPMLWAFVRELVTFLGLAVQYDSTRLFFAGLVGYLVVYVIGLRYFVRFVEHYVHETAHVVAAYLTLRPVYLMLVNPQPEPNEEGSQVHSAPGLLRFVRALAPYCLPLLTLPLLLLRVLVPPPFVPIVNLLIGITMGFHYAHHLPAIVVNPDDFGNAGGWFFSTVLVILANVIVLVIVLSFVIGELAAIGAFFRVAWDRTLENYRAVIRTWQESGIGQ